MNLPPDTEIAQAEKLGRLTGRADQAADRGFSSKRCPYDANGTPSQKVLARRWVHGYTQARPGVGVDYTG